MAEASSTPQVDNPDKIAIAKLTVQVKKLTDANAKYKNLLKLAKERIQEQEDQLTNLRKLEAQTKALAEEKDTPNTIGFDDHHEKDGDETSLNIVRVCQRVKVPSSTQQADEIWALMEMEQITNEMTDNAPKRFRQWKKFESEAELQDYIRRDTGEPLRLPSFSLTPEQSAEIQKSAVAQVSAISEDYRRFRVRSELARKQADAQIRELQTSNVQSAARRIEAETPRNDPHAQISSSHVEKLRAELIAQETHWKEAYENLLAENTALKSSGSEALLASQWRQRFETCRQEKDVLQSRLKEKQSTDESDAMKYEAKYRDLKESFRLYRKKAKELFEEAQNHNPATMMHISDSGSADAKLSYLRNLMVNYLAADHGVRGHMEGAIGTILQFSADDIARIEKKRAESEAWF